MKKMSHTDLNQLEDIAQSWLGKLGYVGAAFGVVQNGQIVGTRALGYADRERQRPFTPHTCVRVGSNTKSMTTALITESPLDWETKAHTIYEGFQLAVPTLSREASLRDLCSMRLGLARGQTYIYGDEFSPTELFEAIKTLQPQSEAMLYNNELFAASGLLLAIANGYSLEDSLQGYINLMEAQLDTWGMHHSGVGNDLNRYGSDYALPYEPDPVNWDMHLVGFPGIGAEAASGAVFASTNDMLTYLLYHLEHPYEVCYVPQVQIAPPNQFYGLGWAISRYEGPTMIWHTGGIDGFLTLSALIPEANAGFFIAVNAGTADYFVQGMGAAFRALVMDTGEPAAMIQRAGQADLDRRTTVTSRIADRISTDHIEHLVGQYQRGVWAEHRSDDDALILHLPPRTLRLYPVENTRSYLAIGLSDILQIHVEHSASKPQLIIEEFEPSA